MVLIHFISTCYNYVASWLTYLEERIKTPLKKNNQQLGAVIKSNFKMTQISQPLFFFPLYLQYLLIISFISLILFITNNNKKKSGNQANALKEIPELKYMHACKFF